MGIVGYGKAGALLHGNLVAATDGLAVAAIVTRDSERQARARREHPDARLFVDVAAMLDEEALDLIIVASPNATHVEVALAAIARGLAVVVDKPLAASAGEGRSLVRDARERGVMLTVFQNRRWDGDFLTVRGLLEEGALGEVARFESRFERWRPELSGGWRESGDPQDAGGLLNDLGSHLVDQALFLFGPAAKVYAELDTRRAGAQTDDDSFVALLHESGVRSHLWMSAVAAQLGPRFRVLGSRAAYVKFGLDVQEELLHAGRRPDDPLWGREADDRWGSLGAGDELRRIPTVPGAYQRFYEGVMLALREDASPPVDPDGVVAGLEVLDAARKSARERRVVELR